jgi:hypothetical protein
MAGKTTDQGTNRSPQGETTGRADYFSPNAHNPANMGRN